MAARKKKEINLLPKEKWEKGVIGKLLRWVLYVGRYVVVFTELVVILAFLYRFGLDRKLTDINEQVDQKQSMVESFGELEDKFRKLQNQLETIKEVQEKQLVVEDALSMISQITPQDAVYSVVDISEDKIVLEGRVISQVGLATLLAKAQEETKFDQVVLENVKSATDKSQVIEFRMIITF